ncbi:MAG TPA: hypothetical protein VNU46_01030, partial [Gemmatimonadaceae bacterium]|nr:hypothetical protein [Gemmatimonadaceae bacterium]
SATPHIIADSVTIPGIPNQPTLVTVIPFVTKDNETDAEKTKVVIPAKVGNAYGNFVLDLGAPRFNLNRTFLQPSATGEIDTITDAHRIPEGDGEDAVHATIRIGTLVDTVIDPTVTGPNPKHINAFLNHMWGNFSWVFAPRLGNIGTSVLEPFETIIDYTHQRVVLIRLDKAGHRLAQVPAYTPKWTTQLIDMPLANDARMWWGIAVRPDYTLDTANTANNTVTKAMDTGAPENGNLLGYPFLSHLGVVGFNHRTHQVILYR